MGPGVEGGEGPRDESWLDKRGLHEHSAWFTEAGMPGSTCVLHRTPEKCQPLPGLGVDPH